MFSREGSLATRAREPARRARVAKLLSRLNIGIEIDAGNGYFVGFDSPDDCGIACSVIG
jgi:hypothetical protein